MVFMCNWVTFYCAFYINIIGAIHRYYESGRRQVNYKQSSRIEAQNLIYIEKLAPKRQQMIQTLNSLSEVKLY